MTEALMRNRKAAGQHLTGPHAPQLVRLIRGPAGYAYADALAAVESFGATYVQQHTALLEALVRFKVQMRLETRRLRLADWIERLDTIIRVHR
jgi:hypothetical protein